MKRSFSRKPKYGQWDIVERRGKEFEVATILGQGAYGTVYVVTDTEGRPFSLKHYDRYPNFEHLKPLKKRLREKIRAMIIDRVVCGKMEHIIGLADDQLIKMALLQEYVEGEHLFRRDSQGQHV